MVAGYYGFTLDVHVSVCPSVVHLSVHPSVRPSIFYFLMITWVNINGFSPNLVCALILWRSGLGLLMDKFGQISSNFYGVICPRHAHIFHFRTLTWVNNKGFQPNLLYALTLRRSGLGLLMGKFCQIFTELSAWDMPIFSFPDNNLSNQTCYIYWYKEIWYGIANGQISSNFYRVICPRHSHIFNSRR